MSWRRHSIWILFIAGCVLVFWRHRVHVEESQNSVIRAASKQYGVEPALIKAIVWRESHFNHKARGRAGEIGLMQLREEAAQEWADAEHIQSFLHEHCLNPRTNTLAGTWYLRKLLRRYRAADNAVPYALADYNAGRRNVLKWISGEAATNSVVFIQQIQFPMTKEYVQAVIQREERYKKSEGRIPKPE
jgi:soluble lytic murein transglycosylase